MLVTHIHLRVFIWDHFVIESPFYASIVERKRYFLRYFFTEFGTHSNKSVFCHYLLEIHLQLYKSFALDMLTFVSM